MPLPRPLVRAVARAKPVIPDALWPLLLTLRSLPGDGPIVGVPAFRRVLALAAHPDDESTGCAGTLALLADAGAQVTLVFATDGDATSGSAAGLVETGRLRRGEAEQACAVIGATPRFLAHPDGGLPAVVEVLTRQLADLVAELRPEVLVLPWFLDGHPDHQALSHALAAVPHLPADLEVWGYETWTALPPNRIVDVTPAMPRKRAAMDGHVTALQALDVRAGLELGRWRSLHGLMGRGYAEAFLALPAARYAELTRQTRQAAPGVNP